ncbi:MAG: ChbG/HpnK family deacetylase [Candidatus Omnitrophica bacterium]|nr:ChbG/HpnK family deacetylase [Candidatus Omnitrophota bacterium]
MKQLIVAADDFGITESVNEGIARSHKEGIVTSLNFLPSGEAFDDALARAKSIGLNEAGAHLALTETISVTEASKIPSLVDAEGRFYKGHTQFLLKFISGSIDLDEVYVEWRSQLQKVSATGIRITNLSSHEHIHMLPKLLDIIIKLAKEYDIPAIRYPHADRSSRRMSVNTVCKSLALLYFEGNMSQALKSSGITAPEHFLGFLDSGNITEEVLLDIIANLEDRTTELVCHPGFLGPEVLDRYKFHKNSEAELYALTSLRVKKSAADKGVGLVSYAEFLSKNKNR